MELFPILYRLIITNRRKMNRRSFMKKIMKLGVSLFLVVLLVVSNVTGCSSSKDDGGMSKSNLTTQETEATPNDNELEVSYPSETTNVYGNSKSEDITADEEFKLSDSAGMAYVPEYNTEEYNAITEYNFKSVKDNPLSTFSVDVDTASYSNVRRMIYDNEEVLPDAVRIEEMINYFQYDYKEPKEGEPFSITTELSDCPWNDDAKLLLIGLQAQEIDMDKRPSTNLVFLLDVSGSMDEEDKLPLTD